MNKPIKGGIVAANIIEGTLDTREYPHLGAVPAVAANVAMVDVERALTYLLGAHDALPAAGGEGIEGLPGLIRECRERLKAKFRAGRPTNDPEHLG
jgi:hypothetical protein